MERSNWGQKSGQERILGIRITRAGWEEALSLGVLTHPGEETYRNADDWRAQSSTAQVRIQWDPERSIRGGKLEYRSIQVGLGRQIVPRYVNEWTVAIIDETPHAHKIHDLIQAGDVEAAKRHLPRERVYPMPPKVAR